MARSAASKVSGNSRVRFIMLDAELPNGDLSQITQAIQNALRPATPHQQRLVTNLSVNARPADSTEDADDQAVEGDVAESETENTNGSESSRVSKPRKLRTPAVLDLDLISEPSFASYAEGKNPSSDMKRFLVVAAWFKEHRNISEITADHVYTCYRSVKWPTNIQDFGQPLRDLKRSQLLNGAGKGRYSINHLGLAEIDNLN